MLRKILRIFTSFYGEITAFLRVGFSVRIRYAFST